MALRNFKRPFEFGPYFYKKKNFLTLRCFQVRIGSTLSDFYFQEEGVPQGSVLSITLFILNQLPHTDHGNLYVDNLNIFCQGKDMRYV